MTSPRTTPRRTTPRRTTPRRTTAALVAALLVVAGACYGGSDDRRESAPPTVDPEVRPATTVDTPATTPPRQDAPPVIGSFDGVSVGFEPVLTLDDPALAMAVRPGDDDHAYLAQRSGTLVRVDLADPSPEPETLLDFHDNVSIDGERGFLGVAFSPDGEWLYTSYTNLAGDTRIDEYAVSGSGGDITIDAASRREVLAQDQPFSNHNGGNVAFGPDGYLYLGLGDGGAAGDPDSRGQDRTDLLGKVLRIDPVGGGTPYGVPDDNPYADGTDGRKEIWITGVRNPWRFSFDAVTGDLWVADVGQNEVEEVDLLPADDEGRNAGRGANLGWSLREGDQAYEGGDVPPGYVPPVVAPTHADGNCSITGGYVYRGLELDLEGAYLYSDLCTSRLTALLVDDAGLVVDEADLGALPDAGPVSFGRDAAGELYVLASGGEVSRIVPG